MLADVDELRKLSLARCKARAQSAKAAPSAAAHAEFDAALDEVAELFEAGESVAALRDPACAARCRRCGSSS